MRLVIPYRINWLVKKGSEKGAHWQFRVMGIDRPVSPEVPPGIAAHLLRYI